MIKGRFVACLFFIFLTIGSGCSRQSPQKAQGYIEGRYTYMATPVSGVLEHLYVQRGTRVKRGQVLFVLELEPESDIYNEMKENLNQSISARDAIVANLTYAKLMFDRDKILVPKNALQQSELDNAKSRYDAFVAQLAQANANIAQAQASVAQQAWTLQQKTISAPVDAIVFDTYYRIGEYTQANQSILSLLAPADIKVIFYIDEAELGGIRLRDPVTVHCDGCSKDYQGVVSFISPSAEYTPPVIYSEQTNEKLVYRIEGEFPPEIAYNLHPGQPVEVTYYPHE